MKPHQDAVQRVRILVTCAADSACVYIYVYLKVYIYICIYVCVYLSVMYQGSYRSSASAALWIPDTKGNTHPDPDSDPEPQHSPVDYG